MSGLRDLRSALDQLFQTPKSAITFTLSIGQKTILTAGSIQGPLMARPVAHLLLNFSRHFSAAQQVNVHLQYRVWLYNGPGGEARHSKFL
jgi:hypothetical protein